MIDEIKDLQGAVDIPDERDYSAEHLFGALEVELPPSVNLNNVPSHNQGRSWHCTAYALTHVMEILNTLEFHLQAMADPEEQWANQKFERGGAESMETEGDSLQNALRTLVKYGLNNKTPAIEVPKFEITNYAFVENKIESVKKWLAKGMPIYTGAGNHCFALVGYHDGMQAFIAKNSYGPTYGKAKDGTFNVPYASFGNLFSKYIVFDKQDLKMIFKDVSESSPMAEAIKFVQEKGLMKGYGSSNEPKERLFMPEKPVTRAELAQVLFNFFNSQNK